MTASIEAIKVRPSGHTLWAMADLHAHNYRTAEGESNRLDRIIKQLWLFCVSAAADPGCIAVCIAGDLFDQGERVPAIVLTKVVDAIHSINRSVLKPRGLPRIFMVSGNHDQAGLNFLDRPAPTALKALHTMKLIELLDCQTYYVEPATKLNAYPLILAGTPYYAKAKDFLTMQADCRARLGFSKGKMILLCHQNPIGSPFGNDFELSDVEKWDLVLNGHIHTHFQRGNVVSIGSPIWRDGSDYGDRKGCVRVHLDNMQVEYVQFPSYEPQRQQAQRAEALGPVIMAGGLPTVEPLDVVDEFGNMYKRSDESKQRGKSYVI